MEDWKTAEEIKNHYGLKSVETIRKWTAHEGMPHLRCGRLIRYSLPAVQNWLEQRGKNKQ